MIARKMLFGGAAVGAGQLIGQGLALLRNIIVARLVSPADFGIASTFVITVSLLEMISDLNTGTLMIQAPDGDDPRLQNCAHTVGVARGLMNSIALLLLSWPLAILFGVPQARWGFQWLALYPLLRGLVHLDATRMQRHMRFMPSVAVEIVSQLTMVLAAWPLAMWCRDYSAILWLLLLQRVAASIGSFIVAERRFAFSWDRASFDRMLCFGWPLIVNGILMFVIMQGDRIVIGSSSRFFVGAKYTMADLGIYSVASGLALVAVSLVTKIALSLMLPALALAQGSPAQFLSRYTRFTQLLALGGALMAVGFIASGRTLILIVYGPKYTDAGAIMGWIGAMQAVRVLRTSPTVAALARGDSHNAMVSNIARLTGFFGAVAAAAVGASLVWFAVCGFAAEVVALVVCVNRLRRGHSVPMTATLQPASLVILAMVVAWSAVATGCEMFSSLFNLSLTALLSLAVAAVWFAMLSSEDRRLISGFRFRGWQREILGQRSDGVLKASVATDSHAASVTRSS